MVIASIDIMQGKVVQLQQGRDLVLERDDAVALAQEFDKYGEIAVIDLDAAMGKGENTALLKSLLPYGECRVGGGIRTIEKAKEMIACGARKVIIGSQAFEDNKIHHSFLRELAAQIGRTRIIIAVDAVHGKIVTRGWRHQTDIALFDAVKELEPYAAELLFTCVEREGTMKGADLDLFTALKKVTKAELTVAGGVATLAEVKQLAAIGADVQLGMALYTGKIHLRDAFIECLSWQKGDLIPTITTDATGQVVMVAYSNQDSLRKAFDTGHMTYFSRSRQNLWTKGETSGHLQHLIRMRADCDKDAILATVRQIGMACHRDTYSCFGDRKFTLHELHELLTARMQANDPATLADETLRQNIVAQAQKCVNAGNRADVIGEAADMFYDLTALLAQRGVPLDDVLAELARRRK